MVLGHFEIRWTLCHVPWTVPGWVCVVSAHLDLLMGVMSEGVLVPWRVVLISKGVWVYVRILCLPEEHGSVER